MQPVTFAAFHVVVALPEFCSEAEQAGMADPQKSGAAQLKSCKSSGEQTTRTTPMEPENHHSNEWKGGYIYIYIRVLWSFLRGACIALRSTSKRFKQLQL